MEALSEKELEDTEQQEETKLEEEEFIGIYIASSTESSNGSLGKVREV